MTGKSRKTIELSDEALDQTAGGADQVSKPVDVAGTALFRAGAADPNARSANNLTQIGLAVHNVSDGTS